MSLYPIRVFRKYLNRTEQYCLSCLNLYFNNKEKKGVFQNTISFFGFDHSSTVLIGQLPTLTVRRSKSRAHKVWKLCAKLLFKRN